MSTPIWRDRTWQARANALISFGLGSILLGAGFPLIANGGHPPLPAPDWARLLVLAALCSTQLFRYRNPVPALFVCTAFACVDAAMGLSLPALLIVGDLLFAATLYGSRRVSRVIVTMVAVFVVVTLFGSILFAPDWRTSVRIALQLVPLPMIPVWWAMNVRQQREIAEAERSRADQLHRIAELDREAAVVGERASMARDLHDVIAGHVSAIAIQSAALLSGPDTGDQRTREVLRSVRENSVAALNEMRAMIGLLRAGENAQPDGLTAPARLRELAGLVRSARAAGLDVRADSDPPTDLPAAVDLSAYRIVQEALTNAVKHAPGGRAEVTLTRADGSLVVEVVNTGLPQPLVTGTGHGLVTMRERATAVGGTLTVGPYRHGWRVRAELPVEEL